MTYDEVIQYFGSAKKVADALKIKPSSISAWKSNGKIPQDSQFKIYYISRHKLDIDNIYKDFFNTVI